QGSNDVSILLSKGRGDSWTFTPGPRLNVGGSGPVAAVVQDVTGPNGGGPDGIPDLLVSNSQSNTVTMLPGVGGGFFSDQHPDVLPTGADPGPVLSAGGNGSGFVTVNRGSNDLTFFPNPADASTGQTIPTGGDT